MMYFPIRWAGFAADNEMAPAIPTPTGMICDACGESFLDGEQGCIMPGVNKDNELFTAAWHRECFMRTITGSAAHQLGKCSCYGGDGEDDPKLTKREQARAAMQLWLAVRNGV